MPSIAYTPTAWQDLPSTESALDKDNLNNIEQGVVNATNQANAALAAGQGANTYTDQATLTGVNATATTGLTPTPGRLNPYDATGATLPVPLPSATGNARALLAVVKVDASANDVTISGTINGAVGTLPLVEANQSVEFLSDGAGSWWTVGGTGVPDASGLASAASVAAIAAQQTALMAVAATVDDLAHGLTIAAGWASGTGRTRWVAPYACQVVSAQLFRDVGDIAVDVANYWQVQLYRRRATVDTLIVQKRTSDEALTHETNWSFDGATWDAAAATLAKGDGLVVKPTNAGTVTSTDEFTVTVVVQPL